MAEPLLQVSDLVVEYGGGRFRAVDGVSLDLEAGSTLGVVGESGSGKTTVGRAIMGRVPVASGSVRFDGRELRGISKSDRRRLARDMQVVFQDPYGSLNPAMTVGDALSEPLLTHGLAKEAKAREQVASILRLVGLDPAAARRYPAEFSGGQRQRVAIARALMTRPRLVICDEPVSALDLSVQAQILNLMADLQAQLGQSYLFIAHNLHVVRRVSHRIVVMYHGRVMEEGPAAEVYDRPAHPYTRDLCEAAPIPDPSRQRARRRVTEETGQHASKGCPFAPRCSYVINECWTVRPPLIPTSHGTHAACLRIDDIPQPGDLEQAPPGEKQVARQAPHTGGTAHDN